MCLIARQESGPKKLHNFFPGLCQIKQEKHKFDQISQLLTLPPFQNEKHLSLIAAEITDKLRLYLVYSVFPKSGPQTET